MLVNLSNEFKVFANDYDPDDWIGYYDPESDWTITEVWDDGDAVWAETDDGGAYEDPYEDEDD